MQIKYYLIKHAVICTNASAYIFLFIHTSIDRSIDIDIDEECMIENGQCSEHWCSFLP